MLKALKNDAIQDIYLRVSRQQTELQFVFKLEEEIKSLHLSFHLFLNILLDHK